MNEDIKIATGLVKPKTTALFFDRIWIPEFYRNHIETYSDIPSCVRFDTLLAEDILPKTDSARMISLSCSDLWEPFEEYNEKQSEHILKKFKNLEEAFMCSVNRNQAIREFVNLCRMRHSLYITPIYLKSTDFEKEFYCGDVENNHEKMCPISIICLKFIPEIIEERLEWKQVLDFRSDIRCVKKLKNFMNWSQVFFKHCTENEILYKCDQMLYQYKNALKKHGILTAVGSFSTVLDMSSAIVNSIPSGINAQIVTSLAAASCLIVFTTNQILDYLEMRNDPIAYIYDVLNIK